MENDPPVKTEDDGGGGSFVRAQTLQIISPVDGSVYAERPLADDKEVLLTLMRARAAQLKWREVPIAERVEIATAFTDAMVADKARVAELLTWQMGRPIRYGPGEVRGFEERARTMIAVAPEMLEIGRAHV